MAEELSETERIALEEAGKRTVDKLRASAQKILGDPHRTEDDTRWLHTLTSVLDFFDGKSQVPMQDMIPVRAIEKVKGDA